MKPTRTHAFADWAGLKARLAAATAAVESGKLSDQRAAELLEERARRLARPHGREEHADKPLELLTFVLASERYAITTRYVQEIRRLEHLSVVPSIPEAFVGLTSFRGDLLAVVDLRKLLGLKVRGLTDLSRVIVMGTGSRPELGLLADAVEELATLHESEIHEPPASLPDTSRRLLRGVTSGALIILDGAALLSDPRLTVDQSARERS